MPLFSKTLGEESCCGVRPLREGSSSSPLERELDGLEPDCEVEEGCYSAWVELTLHEGSIANLSSGLE